MAPLIFTSLFTANIAGQDLDRYKVLFSKVDRLTQIAYDTVIDLRLLSEPIAPWGMPYMQMFEGFNYPKFNVVYETSTAIINNDSIEIIIKTVPFDSISFKKNYKRDSSLYLNSLYFREFPDEFDYPPFYPKFEVSEISVKINDRLTVLPRKHSRNLYNPSFISWSYKGEKMHGINGYVADNNKILLTFTCGEGAGAYIVIMIFDNQGNFETRIEEPLL